MVILSHKFFLAEHDIFGEPVSDSEEEEQNINILELEEENSRLSEDNSRLTDSTSMHVCFSHLYRFNNINCIIMCPGN